MTTTPIAVWGISESDYLALCKLLHSPDYFAASYEDWNERGEAFDEELRLRGIRTRRVEIKAAAFAAWCATKKLVPNVRSFYRFLRTAHLLGHAPTS